MGTLADYWAELQLMGDSSKKKKIYHPLQKNIEINKRRRSDPGGPKKGIHLSISMCGYSNERKFPPDYKYAIYSGGVPVRFILESKFIIKKII